MKGRKHKPTSFKIIQGNAGKRPLNKTEPKPKAAAVPRPPIFLSKDAKAEWSRLAPKLHALNLLTHIDRTAFAAYCEAWARAGLIQPTPGNVIDYGFILEHIAVDPENRTVVLG